MGFLGQSWVFAARPATASTTASGPAYYIGLALLLVAMIVGSIQAYRVWWEVHDVEEPDAPSDLLKSLEEAHAAGELDDAEWERVRRRVLGGEMPSRGAQGRATDAPTGPDETVEGPRDVSSAPSEDQG